MSSEFNLTGETYESQSKWGVWIKLTTPDGKVTKLDSGAIFGSDLEAAIRLYEVLKDWMDEFEGSTCEDPGNNK